MSKHILVINGPNLNLLGAREPHLYGNETLSAIEARAQARADRLGCTLEAFQSNSEGEIVNRIHAARGFANTLRTHTASAPGTKFADAIIINAGAYTHTSVAIRDALSGVKVPFIEVHISNVHAREEFRHRSFLSDKAVAVVAGMGSFGYDAAVEFIATKLELQDPARL